MSRRLIRAHEQPTQRYRGRPGRDPASLTRAYETFVCVAETRSEATRFSKASIEHMTKGKSGREEAFMIGTPDDVIGRIAAYTEGGAQHIELKFICRDVTHMLEMVDAIAKACRPIAAEERERDDD